MVKIYTTGEKTYADDSKFAQIIFGRGSRSTAGQPNAKGKIQLVKLYGRNGQMKGFYENEISRMEVINTAEAVMFPEKYGIDSANAFLQRGRWLWTYYSPVREAIKSANPDINEMSKSSSFYEQVLKVARGERDATDFNPVDNIRTSEKLFSSVFLETLNTSEPNTDFNLELKSGEVLPVHVDSDLSTGGASKPLTGLATIVSQLKIYVEGLPEIRLTSTQLKSAIGTYIAQPTLEEVKKSPEMSGRQYGMRAREEMAKRVAGAKDFIVAVAKDRVLKGIREYTEEDLLTVAEPILRQNVTATLEDSAKQEFGWLDEPIRTDAINKTLATFPAENYAHDFIIDGSREELREEIRRDGAINVIQTNARKFDVVANTRVISDFIGNISLEAVKEQLATEFKSPVYRDWVNADGVSIEQANVMALLPDTLQKLTAVHDDTNSWLLDNGFKKSTDVEDEA